MNKMKNCNTCGAEIAAGAKVCPSCGAKNKPPIYKRVWFWLLIVFVVIPIIGGIASGGDDAASSSNRSDSAASSDADKAVSSDSDSAASSDADDAVPSKNSAFEGDCGIDVSAEMGSSVIGYPELSVSITNTTEKEILAIQFYAVPVDVYGDEITKWTSQNKLYTDTAIGAGESNDISFQFIEDSVKTLELYVYSVYFADGTEWGDKDAAKSTILNNGVLIEVSGES